MADSIADILTIMIWPSTQHGPLSIALSGLVEKWLVVVPYGGCSTGPALSQPFQLGRAPHTRGPVTRTVHLACSPKGSLPARYTLHVPPGELFPHGAPCLFPQGNASRTGTPSRSPRGSFPARYTLLVPPGGAFPYGTPCLIPQGNVSRTGTRPRFPRGSLPTRYTLLVPLGERFPHGLPVPMIGTIVPENKTPQNGPETGTRGWKTGTTFPPKEDHFQA